MHRDTRHLGQRYEDNRGHGYKKKKKDSFLSELFDF
jgi:Zn-finger nucleic acid-binding protein